MPFPLFKFPRFDRHTFIAINDDVVPDAQLALASANPLLISMGAIEGTSHVNKFGENPLIIAGTTADIWDGGTGAGLVYPFPTTADITHLRMAVNQAAMLGQTVQVQGLDANWDLVVQDVVLDAANTSTPVELTTPLIRVFRMKVQANVIADQDIELRNVGGGTTYSIIQAGENQTLMCIYTVPRGKTAYLTQYYGDNVPNGVRQPDSVEFKLRMADRLNGYEFQIKHERGIPINGDGFEHAFNPPMRVSQMTDIKISASVEGGVNDDGHPHAGFDLVLIDN